MILLRVLGRASLERADGEPTGRASRPRSMALLALLATADREGLSREEIVGLLWPDRTDDLARHRLSDTLYVLRQDLGEDVIRQKRDYLRLDPNRVSTDVDAFESNLEEGDPAAALEHYGGDFLSGFRLPGAEPEFEQWVDAERRRLADRRFKAVETLAEEAEQAGRWTTAVERWKDLLVDDPYNSRFALRLMNALATSGDPANALIVAEEHETLIREELGGNPSPEIAELAEHLRSAPPTSADEVIREASPPDSRPDEDLHLPTSRRAGSRASSKAVAGIVLVVSGIVLVTVLSVGALFVWRPIGLTAPIEGRRSVAVLPFANLSSDSEQEYFSDGITEEIINALSGVPGLDVVARTSAFAFKGSDLDIRTVADSLGSGAVLEGSVRRIGDQVRITAQLIDGRTGFHLWSRVWERPTTDVFAIQEEIARGIARHLDLTFATSDSVTLASRGTKSLEAYEEYLLGRYHWNRRTWASLLRAEDHFRRSIEMDSTYAEAWAGLADTYSVMPFYAREYPPEPDNAELGVLAAEAASRAVELGPASAIASTSLAYAHFFRGEWALAEEEFRRAIDLNPGYATAHHWYGEFLAYTGRAEEGIVHSRRAVELDPVSKIANRDLAHTLQLARRYEEALRQFERTIALDPDWAHPWDVLGSTYLALGRYEESLEAFHTGFLLRGQDTTFVRPFHGCMVRYRETGEPQDCETGGGFLEAVWTGQKEAALVALERYAERPDFDHRNLASWHTAWGSDLFGDDPRYRALLERKHITW